MWSMPGFEPGPDWWEASALTTAPSLAPQQTALGPQQTQQITGSVF